jgi:hypothetical protein
MLLGAFVSALPQAETPKAAITSAAVIAKSFIFIIVCLLLRGFRNM